MQHHGHHDVQLVAGMAWQWVLRLSRLGAHVGPAATLLPVVRTLYILDVIQFRFAMAAYFRVLPQYWLIGYAY